MLVLWILFLMLMSSLGLVLFSAFSNKKASQYLPPVGSFAQLGDTQLHYFDEGKDSLHLWPHGSELFVSIDLVAAIQSDQAMQIQV